MAKVPRDPVHFHNVNPRTDGGPGHLSTDGGGADNRPPEISKTKQARDMQ